MIGFIKCETCPMLFEKSSWTTTRRFCDACRKKRAINSYSKHGLNVSPSVLGSISELAVALDLLCKGFEVFRNVTPVGRCDLVAIRNAWILRVEVRTGKRRKGKLVTPRYKKDIGRQDVFATYVPEENLVVYDRELD